MGQTAVDVAQRLQAQLPGVIANGQSSVQRLQQDGVQRIEVCGYMWWGGVAWWCGVWVCFVDLFGCCCTPVHFFFFPLPQNIRSDYQSLSMQMQDTWRYVIIAVFFGVLILLCILASSAIGTGRAPRFGYACTLLLWLQTAVLMLAGAGMRGNIGGVFCVCF